MQIFVSYARNDLLGDEHLRAFLASLAYELQTRRGTKAELLYRDHEQLRVGDDWSEKLGAALANCGILLAVCSPSYLNSEYCSKEFAIFQERHELFRQRNPAEAELVRPIFPIHWIPERKGRSFPDAITCRQYSNDKLPADYAQVGLRHICMLQPEARTRAILELGTDLADALDHSLPPAARPYSLANQPGAWEVPGHAPGAAARPGGPDAPRQIKVRIAIAAGLKQELEGVRKIVAPYGVESVEWCPFMPETDEAVAMDAIRAAMDIKLLPLPTGVDSKLCQHIKAAAENSEITLVLADPWTLRLSVYANLLREVDQLHLGYGGLLVVWNSKDAETAEEEAELDYALSSVFPTKYTDPPPPYHFFRGIDSRAELKQRLEEVLSSARDQLVKRASRVRRAAHPHLEKQAEQAGIDPMSRAVVQGPVGDGS